MPYSHTQPGTFILVTCLICAALGAIPMWRAGLVIPAMALVLIMGAAAVLFSSLTVEVSDAELRWYFGPGLWSYRLPRQEIESAGIVRNRWSTGWGIRIGPEFELYNVSGLDAVELRLKSGEVRRIGTDDPRGLLQALSRSRG